MNAVGWIIVSTSLAAVVLVVIPERQPVPTLLALRAARARQAVREVRPGTVIGPAGAAALLAGAAIRWGPALGAALVVLYGTCAWALSIRGRSARRATRTERMARLAVVLANQATTATTVGEALARAAPLVRGSVGAAAANLAKGYEQGAITDASRAFIAAVPVTAATWLTDILTVTGRGGGRVREVLATLEDLAAAEADAARHFHRIVAAQMVPLVFALVMATATVGAAGLWMPAYAAWLVSPAGQLMALGASVGCLGVCAPVFAAATSAVRS